jgi:hypothetical protein
MACLAYGEIGGSFGSSTFSISIEPGELQEKTFAAGAEKNVLLVFDAFAGNACGDDHRWPFAWQDHTRLKFTISFYLAPGGKDKRARDK